MALVIPKFATEAEEADWGYDNRDLVEQEFLSAFQEGRVKRGGVMQRIAEAKARQVATAIELDETELPEAQAVAQRKGMDLPTYVRSLVHEAIEKEREVA